MGPLTGVRIVEMSNIGPAPFCGMLLADMGADVLRVSRLATVDLGFETEYRFDLLNRNKQAAAINLKTPEGVETVKQLVASADMLIEGFRPGVMERLGLGPEVCAAINPRLVYGRMTGWGQQGFMSHLAGHDINYIAMTGALAAIGPTDGPPVAPLNLIGDFGGGALYLAMGMLAALLEARQSGQGQVIDAAMVDGVASLMSMHLGAPSGRDMGEQARRQPGRWRLTLLFDIPHQRRQVHCGRRGRTALLWIVARQAGTRSCAVAGPARQSAVARAAGSSRQQIRRSQAR